MEIKCKCKACEELCDQVILETQIREDKFEISANQTITYFIFDRTDARALIAELQKFVEEK